MSDTELALFVRALPIGDQHTLGNGTCPATLMWRPVRRVPDRHQPDRKETRPMPLLRTFDLLTPTLLTPECAAPGCSVAGDQYPMIRCRGCGAWFCPDHIPPPDAVRLVRPPHPPPPPLPHHQHPSLPSH